MKKFASVILTLALIFTMSISVFADTTKLTIADDGNREYNGYQLLEVTTSLKTGEHHPATCDGNHKDDCYNYAYTVNAKYRTILQVETLNNGRNTLWGTAGKPANASGVTDVQIVEYLSFQTPNEGTIRQVADRVYREIQAAGLDADAKNLTGNEDVINQGYWMIADVTDLTGNEANSLVMVKTMGQQAVTITPKTALPTVEKKVKDIEDSEDDSILDNAWLDSADHDIGDVVPFKLTATLPSNAQNYTKYALTFHDTLSAGLTLNDASFKVYMYDSKHAADVDTDMNDGTDVTANFVVTTAGLTDGCSFEVACADLYQIANVTKDSAFVVYYEATLNDAAVIGGAGNPNEVYLEFSNNPYGDGTGETEKDKVVVFTYKVVVNKTDSHGHALEGAGFTLYKKDITGAYHAIGTELKGAAMTTFTWTGLDDGDYKLVESTVPAGYNKMADMTFSISATHDEHAEDPTLTSLEGGAMGTGVLDIGTITKDIENHTGTVLPETGAMGTVLFICGGAMLVVLAAVFMITRKKMSVYED